MCRPLLSASSLLPFFFFFFFFLHSFTYHVHASSFCVVSVHMQKGESQIGGSVEAIEQLLARVHSIMALRRRVEAGRGKASNQQRHVGTNACQ